MSNGCGLTTNPDDTPNAPTFSEDGDCSTHPLGPSVAGGASPTVAGQTSLGSPDSTEAPAAASTGIREFEAEFETATHVTDKTSTIRRPDAVSLHYLTAFSIGPIGLGDSSGGAHNRVWRVRAVNGTGTGTGTIYISRANDANTAWENETALFDYTGDAVEIDLAFEQAGRAVVALEIDGEVWLYWFDTVSSAFELTDFVTGRTPRLLLDNPEDTTDSDVLLFYITDGSGLLYRQQRDRYAIEYATPVVDVASKFVEDAFRTTDNRVVVILSIRNSVTGKYSLERLESTLYPIRTDIDSLDISQLIQSGLLEFVIIDGATDVEALDISQLIQSGTLSLILITHTLFDIDALDIAQLIQSGALDVVVIVHTLFDIDALDISQLIQSGALDAVVIVHTLFDIDSLDISQQIQSGSLA